MNVYQRPLFRRNGGPVAPMAQGMMPQGAPMPAAPPMPQGMEQIQAAEQMAQRQGQAMGQEYASLTMQALDSAETPKDLIDAIRGNERPIEARYAELASLVGPEDARATPETVLALVQPTIMMTEQGAMDSGMGELMRSLVGDIEMETEGGAPTQMGQGVGSLMMAGAPAQEPMGVGQPPVANFSRGGAVQRFENGGEASRLEQLYSEMLPVYQGILGDGEESRRMNRAQILFDIADRAGAFAAGINPQTGQSMAGLSPMAQLGAAASGLGGQIGERLAAEQQQQRQLQLAALQAAQGEYSAERAADRAARGDRALGNIYDIIVDGEVVTTMPLSTQGDYSSVLEAYPGATIRPSRTTEPNIREFNNNLVDLTDPNNPRIILEGVADRDLRTIGDTIVDLTDPASPQVVYTGPSQPELRTVGDVLLNVSDPTNPQIVYQGAGERDIRTVNDRVIDFTDPQNPVTLYEPEPTGPSGNFINIETADGEVVSMREDDPRVDQLVQAGGRVVSRTGPTQPTDPLVNPDLMAAYGRGETSAEDTARIQAAIAEQSSPAFNPRTGQFETPTITPLVQAAEDARAESGRLSTVLEYPEEFEVSQEALTRDLTLAEFGGNAFGTRAFMNSLANSVFALVDANAPAPATQRATTAVNALNEDAKVVFRDLTEGRSQEAVNQFAQILPVPGRITDSPSSAAAQVDEVINFFNAQIDNARNSLATGVASQTERQRLEAAIVRGETMVRAYRALQAGIIQGPTGATGVDPAQFRRN